MRCLFVLICFLMSVEGIKAAPDTSKSSIAAVVNNAIITRADLMNRLRFASLSSGLEPTPENMEKMKPQMLRVMIDEQLQLQIGKQFNIDIADDMVQEAIHNIEGSNGMPTGTIMKIMEDNKIPAKIFEDQMRAQLIWMIFIREKYPFKTLEDQFAKKENSELLPSMQLTDWEIDQEIKRQKEKDTKKQYHLAEISLPIDQPDQEAEVKKTLAKLSEELHKGAYFQALAQQFSQSATASHGGDMGWLTEDQMEPEIREAVSNLFPGQLSMPIRTPQGYVIIAFIEQRLPNAEAQALLTMQQVVLPYPQNVTEESARDIIKGHVKIISAAKSCPALEKIVKEDFPSAQTQQVKSITLANLPGPVQNLVSTLGLNQLSAPLPAQEGILLVMICEKESQKPQEFSREDVIDQIISRKHTLLARRELRDMRRHAFIDMRM